MVNKMVRSILLPLVEIDVEASGACLFCLQSACRKRCCKMFGFIADVAMAQQMKDWSLLKFLRWSGVQRAWEQTYVAWSSVVGHGWIGSSRRCMGLVGCEAVDCQQRKATVWENNDSLIWGLHQEILERWVVHQQVYLLVHSTTVGE